MKIILEQKDLEKAITAFIEDTGVCLVGKTVDLDITVGRGTNGNSATVDIIDESGNDEVAELPEVAADGDPVESEDSEPSAPVGPAFS